MNHNVNQVKVLFEDVRDMYDEDTYQAISVLIDKYLTTGYLSRNEQKELFQYLRRTNQVNKSESKIENDSHEVEKGIEDWEDDLEDQTNNVPNRKSTLILPQSVLILIMLMRKLIKNNEKSNQNGITR
jgi:flagellar capping protein FliD